MRIELKLDTRELDRAFASFAKSQLPFAAALTATTLAKGVQAAERAEIKATFDNPTPFTQNAIAVTPATKSRPIATVFAKDIQAQYLEPFTEGGLHALGNKKGILAPRNIDLNQYGNLPRNKIKALLARPDVFVGSVTFKKSGQTVRGIWQRPAVGGRREGGKGTKGATKNAIGGVRTGLKLLVRFEDPLPVKKHLDFQERAAAYVKANAEAAFAAAFAKALASAK